MFVLNLICVVCGLSISFITSLLVEINVIAVIGSCLVFYIAFRQIAEAFKIPEKIIKRSVEKEFKQNERKIKEELEQARRKNEFFEAFESDEEKTRKENNNREFQQYQEMYEQAKLSYQGKNVSEMNLYERSRYYERKLKLFNRFMPIPNILILLTMGFVTLFGQYISLQTTFTLCGLTFIIYTPIFIWSIMVYRKYKKYFHSIQPQIFKQFLKDVGID